MPLVPRMGVMYSAKSFMTFNSDVVTSNQPLFHLHSSHHPKLPHYLMSFLSRRHNTSGREPHPPRRIAGNFPFSSFPITLALHLTFRLLFSSDRQHLHHQPASQQYPLTTCYDASECHSHDVLCFTNQKNGALSRSLSST